MDRHRQVVWAGLAVAVAAAAFFGVRSYWPAERFLPDEFIAARKEGALTAERVVFFANQSLAGLEQIGQFDEKKNYPDALKQTKEELERNGRARQEALILSSHLGTMAAFLPEIKPEKAKGLATEAIGYEVSLVNRLINLNDLLNQLFEVLEKKFRREIKNGDTLATKLIAMINSEIKAINNLNQKFNLSMKQFDGIFNEEKD